MVVFVLDTENGLFQRPMKIVFLLPVNNKNITIIPLVCSLPSQEKGIGLSPESGLDQKITTVFGS